MDKELKQIRDIERFLKKVNKTDSCWIWTGTCHDSPGRLAYGRFWHNNKMKMAHRFSYELHIGNIPDGLQLDHLCRNPPCVNPEHLEPVTARENISRSPFFNGHKTYCKHGHEFTPLNTKIMDDGHRECKICRVRHKEKSKKDSKEKTIKNRLNHKGPFSEKTGQPIKSHCKRGHEFNSSNFKVNKNGARVCFACAKQIRDEISNLMEPTRSKEFCINGHEYTKDNTRINSKGFRMCRACHRKTSNAPKSKDRTRCKNGHEYTEQNIYLNPRGIKECSICRSERAQKRSQKIKALKRKLS